MPNWKDILEEISGIRHAADNSLNAVRGKYMKELADFTGRNVISYYSGFLSKNVNGSEINDEDKNGFMVAVHGMDRTKGLDLILHTEGGGLYATVSLVDYLHKLFRRTGEKVPDIRAIVPQIAMSAGTMLSCCCKEIWMAKHSNLGPIDPQFAGVPAYGVLKEFEEACKQVKNEPHTIPMWQSIIGKYHPTFLSQCQNAIDRSKDFVKKELVDVMFAGQPDATKKATKIVRELSHYTKNKGHDRHIHYDECLAIGLNVKRIEDEYPKEPDVFQDLVLTVHHCYMHTLMNTPCFKIIENHSGVGMKKTSS